MTSLEAQMAQNKLNVYNTLKEALTETQKWHDVDIKCQLFVAYEGLGPVPITEAARAMIRATVNHDLAQRAASIRDEMDSL